MTFKKVVCGGEHTGAITRNGELYLWGDDSNSQLGGDTELNFRYETLNKEYYFDHNPRLIDGEISGKVFDISLGSNVTYVLTRI